MTDTDRELLELAAKAAGLEYECVSHTGRPENDQHQVRDQFGGLVDWNPLTNDGDALRLAVKLGLALQLPHAYAVYVALELDPHKKILEKARPNPYAATRRVIVRAAAEIGRNMK